MSPHNYYKIRGSALLEEDFYPSSLVTDTETLQKYKEITGSKLKLHSEVQETANKTGISTDHIYFIANQKSRSPYVYYDFPLFFELSDMSEDHITFTGIPKSIESQSAMFNELFNKGEYIHLLRCVHERIRILALNKLYGSILDEERYLAFLEVYMYLDYGLLDIKEWIIEDALSKVPEFMKYETKLKLNAISTTDEITIYRGIGSESTPLDKAISWTVEPAIAAKFAAKFGDIGQLVKATVKKDHIIDYINHRNEHETLIHPKHVYRTEVVEQINPDDELELINSHSLLFDYTELFDSMDLRLYHDIHSVHGLKHSQRVMFNVMSLGLAYELDETELKVLKLAAMYHDIGRINDEKDDVHGFKSWEKIIGMQLDSEFELEHKLFKEDIALLRSIISYHMFPDKDMHEIIDRLKTYHDKKRAKQLAAIFMDADALDRIHLGDLDTSYLRLTESHKRLVYAAHLKHIV